MSSTLVKEILEALALALVVFIVIQASAQNFRVEGSSMSPTLEAREYLLVNKLAYLRLDWQRLSGIIPFWRVDEPATTAPFSSPKRGEIIVFHFPQDPGRNFVKRVIGVPGDEVEIVDGQVWVNRAVHPEPYLFNRDDGDMELRRLRNKEYFLMGDNRPHSNDSRSWGPVPEENIVGKLLLVYWPLDKLGRPR